MNGLLFDLKITGHEHISFVLHLLSLIEIQMMFKNSKGVAMTWQHMLRGLLHRFLFI